MSGFFLTHRDIFDNALLKDGERFRAWLWLVSEACWKPAKFDIRGTTVEIQRGQICVSRGQLAKAWKWSPSAVERFLTRLQTEQMIGRETGQGRTVITICNYAKYQDLAAQTGQPTEQPTGQQADSKRTAKEQGNKGTIAIEEPNSPSIATREDDPDPVPVDLVDDPPPPPPPPPPPSKPRRELAVAIALPDDWTPELGPKRAAIVNAWPEGMLENQINRFRRHAQRNQRVALNWNAAFGTWVDRTEQGRTGYGTAGQNTRAMPSGFWPERDHRDGFQRALDRELGLEPTAQPPSAAGRRDDGRPASNPRLC